MKNQERAPKLRSMTAAKLLLLTLLVFKNFRFKQLPQI